MSAADQPKSLLEKILSALIPPPASPSEQEAREAFKNTLRASLADLADGKALNLSATLRNAGQMLGTLADNLAPADTHASVALPAFETVSEWPPMTVEVPLADYATAEDELAVEKHGLTREQRRLLLQFEAFFLVWLALTAIGLQH